MARWPCGHPGISRKREWRAASASRIRHLVERVDELEGRCAAARWPSTVFLRQVWQSKREAGMVTSAIVRFLAFTATALSVGIAFAQTPSAPDSVVLHFDLGSAAIRAQDEALLDQASRLYRDGNPIVMILAGSADTVGLPERNLALSQQRADAVLRALVARGIPAGRFQLVAKGETELAVATGDNVPEEGNRRVEITWR
jgi:outer membrane protein OmpA-like peptidoglycan-associated protein